MTYITNFPTQMPQLKLLQFQLYSEVNEAISNLGDILRTGTTKTKQNIQNITY